MCPTEEYQRKLHPDDLPLRIQQKRIESVQQCHFIVRKNSHCIQTNEILLSIVENKTSKKEDAVLNKRRFMRTANCHKNYTRGINYKQLTNNTSTSIVHDKQNCSNIFCNSAYNPVYDVRGISVFNSSFSSKDLKSNTRSPHYSSAKSSSATYEAINHNSTIVYI